MVSVDYICLYGTKDIHVCQDSAILDNYIVVCYIKPVLCCTYSQTLGPDHIVRYVIIFNFLLGWYQ